MPNLLPIDYIRSRIDYNSETGDMIHKVAKKGCAAGTVAGTEASGRIKVCIDGNQYQAHRLAWAIYYGEWPSKQIDHIDGNPKNNAINNLRLCNQSQNLENQRKSRSNNKSGLLGVSWHKGNSKWRSTIVHNRKQITIGYFETKQDAHIAYINAKRKLHCFCTI